MTVENGVHIVAGTFILLSLALGVWVNHNWSKGAMILKKICGGLVLLDGLYLIHTAR